MFKRKKKWKQGIAFVLSCGILLASGLAPEVHAAECFHKHTETVKEIPADCTNTGFTEGVFCDDCDTYISGHQETGALGHIDTNSDGICDDCGTKFTFRNYQKETCTKDGYTGDKKNGNRIIIGEGIPAKGHKDNNKDFICDVCKEKITRSPIKVTLHYYVTEEFYKAHEADFQKKKVTVKDSEVVPGCKYITEVRQEIQGEEFAVPEVPKIRDFVFAWHSGNTIYQTFMFYDDVELFMSYMDKNTKLEGQAGDAAYYIYHPEEKILEFTGSGRLWSDFETKTEIPWYKYLIKSEKVLMDNGLTSKLWVITK